MPAEDPRAERLLNELGRINSELSAQRRLSSMIVHDLSTPAQVILGLSELLLDHPNLDPLVRRRIEQLHRSAESMGVLLADLTHGFSLEDPVQLELQRLDLVELVTSVVERTHVLANGKEIELRLVVDQPAPEGCRVVGDPQKLERALSNLLGNAIKFSPDGSTVTVTVEGSADQVTVAVTDQGPGISEEAHLRIFEVFQREHSASGVPGRGLGLFITRQIAESHGGSVSVDSEPGQGSTFVLRLPLGDGAQLAELA